MARRLSRTCRSRAGPRCWSWYGAGLAFTLALWPLLARALGMLPDAGYAAARVLAPALAVLPAWWLASVGLARFDTPSIVGGAGALALVAAAAWTRGGRPWSTLLPRLRTALIVEGVFLVAWAGFLALRAANPDLWHPCSAARNPWTTPISTPSSGHRRSRRTTRGTPGAT